MHSLSLFGARVYCLGRRGCLWTPGEPPIHLPPVICKHSFPYVPRGPAASRPVRVLAVRRGGLRGGCALPRNGLEHLLRAARVEAGMPRRKRSLPALVIREAPSPGRARLGMAEAVREQPHAAIPRLLRRSGQRELPRTLAGRTSSAPAASPLRVWPQHQESLDAYGTSSTRRFLLGTMAVQTKEKAACSERMLQDDEKEMAGDVAAKERRLSPGRQEEEAAAIKGSTERRSSEVCCGATGLQ